MFEKIESVVISAIKSKINMDGKDQGIGSDDALSVLGVDSLMQLSIVMEVAETLGIDFSKLTAPIDPPKTVKDIVNIMMF